MIPCYTFFCIFQCSSITELWALPSIQQWKLHHVWDLVNHCHNMACCYQGNFLVSRNCWLPYTCDDYSRVSNVNLLSLCNDRGAVWSGSSLFPFAILSSYIMWDSYLQNFIWGGIWSELDICFTWHVSRAVKHYFQQYIWWYTFPNENFEHGYSHSNVSSFFYTSKTRYLPQNICCVSNVKLLCWPITSDVAHEVGLTDIISQKSQTFEVVQSDLTLFYDRI